MMHNPRLPRPLLLVITAITLPAMSACITPPPPKPPIPAAIIVMRPPAQVIVIAANEMRSTGFTIDTVALASVTGSRLRPTRGNVDVMSCRVPKGVRNDSSLIVVTVGAIPQGAGSRVKIGTEVQALYPAPSDSGAAPIVSKTDCTSNGSIERRLADAIRAE
jgi:hypothetical protein